MSIQATTAEILEELATLRRQNAEYKRSLEQRGSVIKIAKSGGVSVYGLGRFPVTLFKSQWVKLLALTGEIEAFITAHGSELKEKPENFVSKPFIPKPIGS